MSVKLINQFDEADKIAKYWFMFSMLWFPLFTTFGLILAIKFFYPTFLVDAEWTTFGRLRPAHVNGALFGIVSSGLIGAMFYIVPRLSARPLYKPTLARITPFLWNIAVLSGVIMIILGNTQAREYAELPWIIDVGVMITLGIMAYVILGTIMTRREHKLYVSLWFFAGTMLWFPIVYFIGNVMWNPPTGALEGIIDAIFGWYYGHNVLGLWFTTLGVGVWYYFIPRMINRALYSNTLSLISFFAIAFFYTGVGGHHLLQAPIPEWLKTVAVITTALMMVSVLTFAVNIGMTLRKSWHQIITNMPLRFIVFGFICYIFVSIQGSFQGLRSTNLYLHFSQWPVGHAHLALLGAFAFTAVGVTFWLVPRITGKKLYSDKLMSVTWWLSFTGFIFFMSGMTIAGIVANSAWAQHMTVASALPMLQPHFVVRAIGGGVIVVAAYIFAYTIIRTFLSQSPANTIPAPNQEMVVKS
jgi:cytochrome c oxidase cbb3-type subunit I/II